MLGNFLFDRKRFFDEYRREFRSLSQQQVNGLNRLLDSIENDPYLIRIEWPAYMLGTVKRETGSTYHPIHEYGGKSYFIRRYGGHTRKGRELGNETQEEGYYYAGKGDVQLTGEDNYEKAEVALRRDYPEVVAEFERMTGRKFDLTIGDQPNDLDDPRNAMYPPISYAIMSHGMRTGMFTGVKLPETGRNYFQWRKIVNGLDHAQEIADDAEKFARILRASLRDADENDILEIQPSSTAVVPAGTQAAYQHEPAYTVETPEPGAAGSPAVNGDGVVPVGDAPDVPPSSWLSVEDWKPFCLRWLKRIWGFGVTGNMTQAVGFAGAAFRDPQNGYIYIGIAVVLFVIIAVIGLLLTSGLVGLLWYNRKEIGGYITEQRRTLMDPTKKNYGLTFEKK